eukprot:PITA_16944
MKAIIATFSLKGKEDIWWEYLKTVRGIHEEDLTWNEFERLFKKKYLLERYFDDRAKESCELKMGSMTNEEYTSRFLELLSTLLGMDWLYLHINKVDCYEKNIECLDDNEELRVLLGKKKATLVRMVTVMQAKHSHRKWCMLFAVHISNDKGKEVEDADVLRRYLVLQYFQDVFPIDILDFPPHREVEFSIELVLRVAPTSKAPYRMSTPEFVELKL